MKIIGIVGSPREGGNVEILVEESLKGAADAGAETKIIRLDDLDIAPCKACMECKTSDGECATDDDMQNIFAELKDADGFILGSPVYMWQMSAQSKLFTDRLYAFFGTPLHEEFSGKKVALIFSQGNPDENLFKEYFLYTKDLFEFMGFNVVGLLSSVNNPEPGVVKNKDTVLEKANEIGKKLVSN